MSEAEQLLQRPEFPRSNAYPPAFALDNQMGPNALWLTEWLCEKLPLERGMKVLDLGCGKALSSIFLARELGVTVFACDLWMSPDNNLRRAVEMGCSSSVFPMHVEAHALPFAPGFFDAVISIDAYQYFGTDELYLDYLARYVRPGGLFGIVVPGLLQPIGRDVPEHLTEPQSNGKVFWEDACRSFKTAGFWQSLFDGCGKVRKVNVDAQPDGWQHWRDFERALERSGKAIFPSDAEAIDRDAGRYLGFLRVVAERGGPVDDHNLYDPALGRHVGVDR